MTLSAGVAAMGRGGAFALKSSESGGTLRKVPLARFSPRILRGDTIQDLVNNNGAPVNKTIGLALGQFSLVAPLILAIFPADFWTRAFGSTIGDTDASNYHLFTRWPDGNGTAPDVYDLCKFATAIITIRWDPNGMVSAIYVQFSGMIIDPESGTATALTAPGSNPLSTGNVMSAAQADLSGVSDYVEMQITVSTGLGVTKGKKAGTSAALPVLCKGLLMGGQSGTVAITQHRSAGTTIGDTGTEGTIVTSIGTTGAGIAISTDIMAMAKESPSSISPNYVVRTYALKTQSGLTLPFRVTDL
jgi:hypothetical protein